MSVQNVLNTAQSYGASALNWITTNGSAAAHYIADLAQRVWAAVQPHFEQLKDWVMNNQGTAAVVGVCVAAGALFAASFSRIVDCILCRTPAVVVPVAPGAAVVVDPNAAPATLVATNV
ncbi:MAG TPA: hypothetical protein VIJ46_03175 [Rhabdochlamydiaceae bacterium]